MDPNHALQTSKVDWDLFCEKMGYKNPTTAKARWGQIKNDLMRCAKGESGSIPQKTRTISTQATPHRKRKGGHLFDPEDDEENEDSSRHNLSYSKQKQIKKENNVDADDETITKHNETKFSAEPKVLLNPKYDTKNVKKEVDYEDDDAVFLQKLQH